jgi:hypothetical protein
LGWGLTGQIAELATSSTDFPQEKEKIGASPATGRPHFGTGKHPPIVIVCNQRYVLPVAAADHDPDPTSSCPASTFASKPINDATHPAEKVPTITCTERSFAWQISRNQFAGAA